MARSSGNNSMNSNLGDDQSPTFQERTKQPKAGFVLTEATEFDQAFSQATDKFKKMTLQIFKTPNEAVPLNDLKLMVDTTKSLGNFFNNRTYAPYMNELINNTKNIYKKAGSFWTRIATLLATVVGIGCIIVGALGLVPSLGGSAALIVTGSLLCTAVHVPGFLNTPGHLKRKSVDAVNNDVQNLLTKAKKLRSAEIKTQNNADNYSYRPSNQ
jgi:hypothetical protein